MKKLILLEILLVILLVSSLAVAAQPDQDFMRCEMYFGSISSSRDIKVTLDEFINKGGLKPGTWTKTNKYKPMEYWIYKTFYKGRSTELYLTNSHSINRIIEVGGIEINKKALSPVQKTKLLQELYNSLPSVKQDTIVKFGKTNGLYKSNKNVYLDDETYTIEKQVNIYDANPSFASISISTKATVDGMQDLPICDISHKKIPVVSTGSPGDYELIFENNDCAVKVTVALNSSYETTHVSLNYKGKCVNYCDRSKIPNSIKDEDIFPTSGIMEDANAIAKEENRKKIEEQNRWK